MMLLYQLLILLYYLYKHASQSGNLAHAFALNKPAVVTSLEGLKAEIEASGLGFLVPVDDLDELRKSITILLTSDLILETYREHAKGYVANYIVWENIAKKHTLVYENAIDRITIWGKGKNNDDYLIISFIIKCCRKQFAEVLGHFEHLLYLPTLVR